MYAIIGLGNPEKKYAKTRHNIGFVVIDELASRMDIDVKTRRHQAICGAGNFAGEKIILVKPQTYMNASGQSVRAVMDFYKLDPETEIIVISDDVALPIGKVRVREHGSAGGHNGLKDIIRHLGTDKFTRVRVGVGDNDGKDMIKHVLKRMSKAERQAVAEGVDNAASAIETIIQSDVETAMNKYN